MTTEQDAVAALARALNGIRGWMRPDFPAELLRQLRALDPADRAAIAAALATADWREFLVALGRQAQQRAAIESIEEAR